MAQPYHIIATPDENGYIITIPEYPKAMAHCERVEDITAVAENLVMIARIEAGEPVLTHCPKCGKEYTGIPVLSRADHSTLICPDCGSREEIAAIAEEKDKK